MEKISIGRKIERTTLVQEQYHQGQEVDEEDMFGVSVNLVESIRKKIG